MFNRKWHDVQTNAWTRGSHHPFTDGALSGFGLPDSIRSTKVIMFVKMQIHLPRVWEYPVMSSSWKKINLTGFYKSCFIFY